MKFKKSFQKRIYLSFNGKIAAASYITFSEKIKNKFECINVFADDTIHTMEMDSPVIEFKSADKIRLSMDNDFTNFCRILYW